MICNTKNTYSNRISTQVCNYKYPCVICHRPCKENVQNSIACSICDCWTHQKCTNLSLSEFDKFCDPENSELRFYCQICMYGTECNKENQTCLTASEIGLIDPNDIYNLSPNSIFRDKDDVPTTEYFTAEELNFEIQKSPRQHSPYSYQCRKLTKKCRCNH